LCPRSIHESRRLLREDERELVAAMVASKGDNQRLVENLASVLVEEMNDGGMGSLLFVSDAVLDRRFGAQLAEASFLDEDGVLVSVTLNVDQRGELFELDLWKVDNSYLKRFPAIRNVQIMSR